MFNNLEERHPVLGYLIDNCKELFTTVELLGVFEGVESCSSLLLHAHNIESLTFYEDLSFTNDPDVKEKFKKKYLGWERILPNLKVKITDANNFSGNATFTIIDLAYPLLQLYNNDRTKLQKNWFVLAGYGGNLSGTADIINLMQDENLIPILKFRGHVFVTKSLDEYDRIFNLVLETLNKSTFLFVFEEYNSRRLITVTDNGSYDYKVENL